MINTTNPRVLIVNDDGIDGPGIKLLEKIVRQFTDDVWVVAPDEERSGAGHSVSISHPIRVKKIDDRHFAVKGTPTDCALLGIYEFLADRKPDILLSGINAGPNLAEDMTYSGTASAAMEGAMLGIPAVALSQLRSYGNPVLWQTSEQVLPGVIKTLLSAKWTPGMFVNVNVPNVEPSLIQGTKVVSQGQRPPGSFKPLASVDARHVPFYWIKIAFTQAQWPENTDLKAVEDNFVSVTPMKLDMTHYQVMEEFTQLFEQ